MTKKKPDGEKKKRGRKSKFDPNKHPALVKELAEQGLTNEQIAGRLGISTATLDAWMNKNPEFLSAIKTGKKHADDLVVDSLYKRACGYKITEKKVVKNPDGTTRMEITEKEVAPDPTSMIFWLKCRQPKEWRDVQRVEHSGTVAVETLSDAEVIQRARSILSSK